ncbi:hypothetical protein [uncultured Desulfosarcina sp.]|uniref:hypothetical protein n=1 Tax=uncultured Desulfosarcina sp. TaxID=218289 RepID=UPI0029C89E8C|nr:hypothetical protein [uncultured Desulfosarcina sp.]
MRSKKDILRNLIGRESIKLLLRPMLRWKSLDDPIEGYSIMLGVPWALRHLLKVNLDFISRTDLTHCHRICIAFDRRRQPGYLEIISETRNAFPELPLSFNHYAALPGFVVEKVNVSTFYNSLNCATLLPNIETRYAILHDFDLYPIVPEYFESVYRSIRTHQWHFCGLEKTRFDGLTDQDNVFGTWCLGMDVKWLRSKFHPIDIFHRVKDLEGRQISLDPFSAIELGTSRRGPIDHLDGGACCHVKNLCSTYLRFTTGRPAVIVWRLHYLWYLEFLSGEPQNLLSAIEAMENAKSSLLQIGDYRADFSDADPTCANVLRNELMHMETALHGAMRPEINRYIVAFEKFLNNS